MVFAGVFRFRMRDLAPCYVPLLFLLLCSGVFLDVDAVATVVAEVRSATGTRMVRMSIPSVCGTSVSDNEMGIYPLIFRDTLATPGSPGTHTMRGVVP